MRVFNAAVISSVLLFSTANTIQALPARGSCLSQYTHDVQVCDDFYSNGADGRPTPFAHAGCILDANTSYYACGIESFFN